MLDSILESLRVISLPTKTNFRSVTAREVALFEEAQGWAEFSPFLEYAPSECVPWLVSAIESAVVPTPISYHERIEINATLPAVTDKEKISEILSLFPGCNTIKIKIGNDFKEDLARIAHVKDLRNDAKIRLDVNGSWSVDQAIVSLYAIDEHFGPIEYVEQPCATIDELRELKRRLKISVQIAGDEIIRKSPDPLAVDLRGAVDIVMLKVAPLGGIKKAKEIASFHGLPVVVSSALESAVGISYGLKLAASFEDQEFAAGLGTGRLLALDVADLPVENGSLELKSVTPSQADLKKYEVSPDRLEWWRERIRQTWKSGAEAWVKREGWIP
jgi:O-succinylbenzoate synthase